MGLTVNVCLRTSARSNEFLQPRRSLADAPRENCREIRWGVWVVISRRLSARTGLQQYRREAAGLGCALHGRDQGWTRHDADRL